jgi:hypothetical protein
MAQPGHWSECGRATSLANSTAANRPHRSVFSFGGDNRKMKSVMYLVCSGCWLLFAIGCLALPAIVGDSGAGIPLFGPAIGIGHLIALVFLAGFCILVSAAFLLRAVLQAKDQAEWIRDDSE